MVEQSLKNRTVKGVLWSSIERFSVQGVQFLVMLVIARILDPSDYGLVGMLAIFISIAQVLLDCGFSQALIRKQNRTDTDCSTVFFFNLIVSFFIYLFFYLISPFVALFFNEPLLKDLMRVLSIVVIINSFAIVQRALFAVVINFKALAKASSFSALISGFIGILLAYNGFGVWTLVWQQILNALFNTVFLWVISSWRPKLIYSWTSFKDLFNFGSKLLISGLINTTYVNIYQIAIGKVFSSVSLGYYARAKHFAQLPSQNVTEIMQRVTYPVLCKMQDNDEILKKNYRQLLKITAFVVFPLMCLLAGVSKPLIICLIGEKWSYASTLLIPICLSIMWHPIHAINLNLLQVKGRSDLFLKLEIIKTTIGILILISSIPLGLLMMCYFSILSSLVSLFINTYYTGKILNLTFSLQMRDLSAILFLSISMFFLVYYVSSLFDKSFVQLFIGITFGIVFYFSLAFIFKFKELFYIKLIVHQKQ